MKTETPISYSTNAELCELLAQPFTYPPDDTPRPRNVQSLLQLDPPAKIVCQYSVPPDVQHFCPWLLQHSNAFDERFQALNTVLIPILDSDRDQFVSGILSEDDCHAVWDALICRPLVYLCTYSRRLRLQYTRNSGDRYKSGTLTNLSRPDFLCYLRKSLIFRGEEKKSEEDLETAQTELTQKLGQWNPIFYGNLPFVFAYATGGLAIQYVLTLVDILHKCWPITIIKK